MSLRHSDVGYQIDVVSPFLVGKPQMEIDMTNKTLTISEYAESILKTYEDPETGCSSRDEVAFQSCRQNYFLKQQNQILQNQQSNPKPEESVQLKTETQTRVEEVNYVQKESIESNGISPTIPYLLILIVVVAATIIITKRLILRGAK